MLNTIARPGGHEGRKDFEMKFAEINKLFTDKVAEYIGKGYTINAGSMGGSQGEITKVDVTDGTKIIRILLDTGRENSEYYLGVEYVELLVGEAPSESVRPNTSDYADTIWNNRLAKIEATRFYVICENRKREKIYGTKEEAAAAQKKQCARWEVKNSLCKTEDVTEKTMEIALKVIRDKLGITRIIRSKVKVERRYGQYIITYRGRCFCIGKERRAV